MSGDFNGDGVVNLADYTVWRDFLGATEDGTILAGNGNGGVVDSTDYALWKTNFGLQSGSIAALGQASVPEPSTLILTALMGISAGRSVTPQVARNSYAAQAPPGLARG